MKMLKNLLRSDFGGFLFILLLVNTNQSFAQDYFYYYHQSKVPLLEIRGRYAIQFLAAVSDEQKVSFLQNQNLDILSSIDGVTGYTLAQSPVPSSNTLKNLKKSSLLRDAMPLFKTSNGIECMVPNRLIVKYKSYMSEEDIDNLNREHGVSVIKKYPYRKNIYILTVDHGGGLDALIKANQFHLLPEVAFAEPDLFSFSGLLSITPNDPFFDNQWYLNKIKASEAWEVTKGSSSIVVAVTDEGFDLQHEDLVNRYHRDGSGNIVGTDETDQGDNSPQAQNDDAHGSACAGIIGAETDNQAGISGLDWSCQIMPVQIFYNDDDLLNWPQNALQISASWTAAGIDFAWQNSADVISMSWSQSQSNMIDIAIADAATQGRNGLGTILVAASGNSFTSNVSYPADLDSYVIAVGATDQNDVRWDYSNYDNTLDLVAPSGEGQVGVPVDPVVCPQAPQNHDVRKLLGDIWTTDLTGGAGYNPDNCRYASDPPRGDAAGHYSGRFGGTSASCPQVAALAALILSIDPDLTRQQVQDILQNTADKVPAMGGQSFDPEYGHGRINAYEAVQEAIPTKITTDITSDTIWNTHVLVRKPSSGVDLYVDGVTLNIDAGAVVVVEAQVRLTAINGGAINIEPGAQVCLEPQAEIIAGDNSYVNDNGANICFHGNQACLATNGGTLKFTSGLTRTVDNGGWIAGFYPSAGTIEFGDNVQLVFEDGAELIVQEGTTFKMGDGADIVVKNDAKATITGTAANPITFTAADGTPSRSEWGTIYLYGDNNTVEHAIIKGSDWGLKFYGNPSATSGNTVKNCTLKKNDQAIRAENTEVDVYDCTIEDNRHAFVLINNPNGIYLDGNTVKDNDRDGIYAIGSVVDVFNTTLDNNGMGNTSTYHGIWASNSSDIALGSRTYSSNSGGYNTIKNNHGAGIYRSSDSYVLAGYYVKAGTEQAGYNSIYGNGTYSGTYSGKDIYNDNTATTYAHKIYWASSGGPSSGQFTGPVDYSNWLSSPPAPGAIAIGPPDAHALLRSQTSGGPVPSADAAPLLSSAGTLHSGTGESGHAHLSVLAQRPEANGAKCIC